MQSIQTQSRPASITLNQLKLQIAHGIQKSGYREVIIPPKTAIRNRPLISNPQNQSESVQRVMQYYAKKASCASSNLLTSIHPYGISP